MFDGGIDGIDVVGELDGESVDTVGDTEGDVVGLLVGVDGCCVGFGVGDTVGNAVKSSGSFPGQLPVHSNDLACDTSIFPKFSQLVEPSHSN